MNGADDERNAVGTAVPPGRATLFQRVRDRNGNPLIALVALLGIVAIIVVFALWSVFIRPTGSASQAGTTTALASPSTAVTAAAPGLGTGAGGVPPTPFALPSPPDEPSPVPGPHAAAAATAGTLPPRGPSGCDPRYPFAAGACSVQAPPSPAPRAPGAPMATTVPPPTTSANSVPSLSGQRAPAGTAPAPPPAAAARAPEREAPTAYARAMPMPTPTQTSTIGWNDEAPQLETAVSPTSPVREAAIASAPAPAQPAAPRSALGSSNAPGYIEPASDAQVGVGTVITARLRTKVVSDLPGYACATVTQPVYDSASHTIEVIPAGADLCGPYSAALVSGQNRLLLAWTTLRFPHGGREFNLAAQPSTDAQGASGIAGDTDVHRGQVFTTAFLLTVLGAAEAAIAPQTGGTIVTAPSVGQQARTAAGQQVSGVAGRLVDQSVQRPPTIILRPPTAVNVIVTRDLPLERYEVRATQ